LSGRGPWRHPSTQLTRVSQRYTTTRTFITAPHGALVFDAAERTVSTSGVRACGVTIDAWTLARLVATSPNGRS